MPVEDTHLGITSKKHKNKSGKDVLIVKGFSQNWQLSTF